MIFPLLRPALFALDAERAHGLTITALGAWGGRGGAPVATPVLRSTVAGLEFANPVGLAAGRKWAVSAASSTSCSEWLFKARLP